MTLLFVCGCDSLSQQIGIEPWQVYEEPPPINLTQEEQGYIDALTGQNSDAAKAVLQNFSGDEQKVIKRLQKGITPAAVKIMKQKNAWRAIVQAHNKHAQELFDQALTTSGVKIKDKTLVPVKKY